MKIKDVKSITDIKVGDRLLICDTANEIQLAVVQYVKVSDQDGTEIIINKKRNRYFNLGLYLNGESWAKDVKIVQL